MDRLKATLNSLLQADEIAQVTEPKTMGQQLGGPWKERQK